MLKSQEIVTVRKQWHQLTQLRLERKPSAPPTNALRLPALASLRLKNEALPIHVQHVHPADTFVGLRRFDW